MVNYNVYNVINEYIVYGVVNYGTPNICFNN